MTTTKGLSSWWTSDVKAEDKTGTISEFGFYNHKAIHYMKIIDLKPSSEVKWICQKSPIEEWLQTELTFRIKEGTDGNQIQFIQSGFKSTEQGFGRFNYSWGVYLTSLKKFVETGKGSPNTT